MVATYSSNVYTFVSGKLWRPVYYLDYSRQLSGVIPHDIT